MKQTSLLRILAAGLLSAFASVGSGNAAPPDKVSIGYFPDIWSGAIVAIAEQQGFFRQAGIEVEAQRFTAGAPAVAALASGNLQLSYVGLGPMPAIMGGAAKIVGFDNITYSDQVLVLEDSGIQKISDLKGQQVIVPKSSGSQMLLYIALKQAGLKTADIQEVSGSPATIVSAMASKQVKAAAIWSPFNAQIAGAVKTKVLVTGRDFYPNYVWPGLWIANPAFVKTHQDVLQRALWAIQQATDWRAAHRAEAGAIAAKAYDIPASTVEQAMAATQYFTAKELALAFTDGTVNKWMQGVTEQLTLIGALDKPVATSDYIVSQPYVDAQAKGLK
jgi:NitT/TauT family transport system substrate-binding protein